MFNETSPLLTSPHGFFGRNGGVSEDIFASLNCGFGSGDDKEKVSENRARIAAHFGASDVLTLYQTHSADVISLRTPWESDSQPEADSMVTQTPGLLLGILTADCTPVLLEDPHARVIGAAHAGWKGATGGVLEATVEAMCALGAKREHIRAAIGPCIAQASYEVGEEFIARINDPRFFKDRYFDLKAYNAARLKHAGIDAIGISPRDTCAEEEYFFSYRRATLRKEPRYGRQLSCIMLE